MLSALERLHDSWPALDGALMDCGVWRLRWVLGDHPNHDRCAGCMHFWVRQPVYILDMADVLEDLHRQRKIAAGPWPAVRRELDAIAAAGLLERGELDQYYARIAGCLRSYLSQRFDVPVAAMTPTELEHRLEEAAVDRWPARLSVNLLQQCEDVRFAHYRPARERAEADLSAAHELVTLTTKEESAPSERPEPARTT